MHALAHAVSLHYMAYNFASPHGTLTNVARGYHNTPDLRHVFGGIASAWRWAVHHPVVLIAVVAAWALYTAWAYKWSKRQPREPADEKATLHGTAQVQSFKQTKATDWHSAIEMERSGGRNLLGRKTEAAKNAKYVCAVKLAVHIPGREEYVAVVKKPLGPEQRAAMQPGATVSVRVDPNDDPKNVRLDVDRPIA
jgi:hypothetical protein